MVSVDQAATGCGTALQCLLTLGQPEGVTWVLLELIHAELGVVRQRDQFVQRLLTGSTERRLVCASLLVLLLLKFSGAVCG